MAGKRKVVLGYDLERTITERLADGLDPPRERARVGGVADRGQVMAAHIGRYPPESPLVVERPGQGFGFPEIPFDPPGFCQREQ